MMRPLRARRPADRIPSPMHELVHRNKAGMKMPRAQKGAVCLVLVVLGMLVFAVGTTSLNRVKFSSLRSSWPYDLAFYHHAAWNHAQGRSTIYMLVPVWYGPSDHNGPWVFRHGHFQPIYWLIAQFYRLWPGVETLFLFNSVFIAIGALPLYWWGERRLKSRRMGLLLGFCYLLHPTICHLGFNDFRTMHLGIGPALFALWFHSERKLVPFAVASVLMLACREEYVFLIALFGILNWSRTESRKQMLVWTLGPVAIAVLWALLINLYFLETYDRLWPLLARGGNPQPKAESGGFLSRLPVFLSIALLPGVLGLLGPEVWVFALPSVAMTDTMFWPGFPQHYLSQLSLALVLVFWAFAKGITRIWPWLSATPKGLRWTPVALGCLVLLCFAHFGWRAYHAYLSERPQHEVMERVQRKLPADSTIMACKPVLPPLSRYPRVFTYQGLPYGTDERPTTPELRSMVAELAGVCDLIVTQDGSEWLDELAARSGRFEPAEEVEGLRPDTYREAWLGHRVAAPQPTIYRFHVARMDAARPDNPEQRLQEILWWHRMNKTKRKRAGILAENPSP